MKAIQPRSPFTSRLNSPKYSRSSSSGFTLIELMVVILIAGMLVTFASLSVSNSSDKQLETEAKRVVSLMRYAADEAIMNSREIILKVEKQKYSFVVPGADNTFVDLGESDPIFRARELPEHMFFEGDIDGEKLVFEEKRDKEAEPDSGKVGIFSSGELTPFNISLMQEDGVGYDLAGEFNGTIEFLGKTEKQ